LSFIAQFIADTQGYAEYLWREITFSNTPFWKNYFWWLVLVSLFFMLLEWLSPWRKHQAKFRKDFWLDAFYMFFNFFLFSLIGFLAISNIVVEAFDQFFLESLNIDLKTSNPMRSWDRGWILLTGFIISDFLQWNIHRLLHRVPFLWEFHKLHHSVKEMGFAAHLRYHWMETIVYKSLQYIPLAILGIGLYDFFIIHIISVIVGHFNHANFAPNIGPLKYLINNPRMHIWHHSKKWPDKMRFGVNFGITLSIWDWLFGTAWIPESGRDIELGFPEDEKYPKSFFRQITYGFWPKKRKRTS
jgi:sterol desaturase/sphingolipid hydroxylase (fatty acid hydroxylase superfamily)